MELHGEHISPTKMVSGYREMDMVVFMIRTKQGKKCIPFWQRSIQNCFAAHPNPFDVLLIVLRHKCT
jgi:hypothetical protein